MGVGMTSAPIYNEEPAPIYQRQYENSTTATSQEEQELFDYAIEINTNTWKQTVTGINFPDLTQTPTKAEMRYANKKYHDTVVNQAGTLTRTRYDTLNIARYTNPQTGWLIDQRERHEIGEPETEVSEYNNSVDAICFTPSYNMMSGYIALRFQDRLRLTFTALSTTTLPEGVYHANLKRQYTVYYTNTLDWSTLINRSVTKNNYYNRDLIKNITEGRLGQNYGTTTLTDDINLGILNPTAGQNPMYIEGYTTYYANLHATETNQINVTVPAVREKNNYYITYSTQIIKIYDQNNNDVTDNLRDNYGLRILGIYDAYATTGSSYNTLNTNEVLNTWGINHANQLAVYGQYVFPTVQEVVDIPNIMFTVLGMPFTFISTGLNLTLFPGTNYAINIGNLFLMIIAVGTFIFLLRIILKVKG